VPHTRFDPARTRYELWAMDTFDRESDPSVDVRGEGLEAGLAELWRRVLREGVRDDGRATFTSFTLVLTDRDTTGRTDLGVQPSDNRALADARRCLYGEPGPGQERDAPRTVEPLPEPRERQILSALARAHATLLEDSPRSAAGWQPHSPAARILATVAGACDADDLLARLASLAG
jgi:hypothetical protein